MDKKRVLICGAGSIGIFLGAKVYSKKHEVYLFGRRKLKAAENESDVRDRAHGYRRDIDGVKKCSPPAGGLHGGLKRNRVQSPTAGSLMACNSRMNSLAQASAISCQSGVVKRFWSYAFASEYMLFVCLSWCLICKSLSLY